MTVCLLRDKLSRQASPLSSRGIQPSDNGTLPREAVVLCRWSHRYGVALGDSVKKNVDTFLEVDVAYADAGWQYSTVGRSTVRRAVVNRRQALLTVGHCALGGSIPPARRSSSHVGAWWQYSTVRRFVVCAGVRVAVFRLHRSRLPGRVHRVVSTRPEGGRIAISYRVAAGDVICVAAVSRAYGRYANSSCSVGVVAVVTPLSLPRRPVRRTLTSFVVRASPSRCSSCCCCRANQQDC